MIHLHSFNATIIIPYSLHFLTSFNPLHYQLELETAWIPAVGINSTSYAVNIYPMSISWFNRHGSIPSNTQVEPLSICSDLSIWFQTYNYNNALMISLVLLSMEWMARLWNFFTLQSFLQWYLFIFMISILKIAFQSPSNLQQSWSSVYSIIPDNKKVIMFMSLPILI